jgi:hypothetical protein
VAQAGQVVNVPGEGRHPGNWNVRVRGSETVGQSLILAGQRRPLGMNLE